MLTGGHGAIHHIICTHTAVAREGGREGREEGSFGMRQYFRMKIAQMNTKGIYL